MLGSRVTMESLSSYFVDVIVVLLMSCCWYGQVISAQSTPPAFFVFGDSLVDSGNNNYLPTIARANRRPYGIDYVNHRPTGRFSNGMNIPDIISEMLRVESVIPYLDPSLRGDNLLRGANFASAGVGILNDTGIQFADIIRMPLQLAYFREYQNRVAAIIGRPAIDRLVARSLVSITLGGNDYVNNYYLVPFSLRSRQYSLPAYTRFIISEYKKQLATLHELGARRIMVTGLGPMGCAPAERATRSRNGECDPTLQYASSLFNSQLRTIVDQLNAQFGGQIYILANSFSVGMELASNPQAYGFKNARDACCGQGRFNGIGLCTSLSNLCQNRSAYVFWDSYHPSERACRVIAGRFMNGPSSDISPMNLSTMLGLNI